jgi:cytochrome c-type biogenesis protein CcmH
MTQLSLRAFCLALAMIAAAGLIAPGPAVAVTPQEILPDKGLEKRAREISAELRCLVCQNQSIDDSDAPLAHDLRILVRERLTAGDSDAQVLDFVVARYGDFVLLKPPFSMATLLLWMMPLIALAGAGAILWSNFRPGAATPATRARSVLTPEEQAALDTLDDGNSSTKS